MQLHLTRILLCTAVISALFSCKKDSTKPATTTTTSPAGLPAALPTDGSIVFVNIDSLMEKYNFYQDTKKQLEGRIESMGRDMDNKVQALYKRAGELEAKVQDMTRQQFDEAQKSLSEEEGRIMKSRENMEKNFAKEQEALDKELKSKINTYLAELSKKKGYKYILSYTSAGLGMLYGDPSLDVTNMVIEELNSTYKASKK